MTGGFQPAANDERAPPPTPDAGTGRGLISTAARRRDATPVGEGSPSLRFFCLVRQGARADTVGRVRTRTRKLYFTRIVV